MKLKKQNLQKKKISEQDTILYPKHIMKNLKKTLDLFFRTCFLQ